MQTNYENALSFIESLGWNDENLRKADGIIPLVATMLELYSKGQELKPTDIKMDNLIEKAKKILSEADSGSIACSHYNNGFLDGIKFTESELKNCIKPTIMRWLDYPEHQPNVGDEVVICYTSNKEIGLQKRELVEWTFKTMNNSANNPNLKFKWLRLPAIA